MKAIISKEKLPKFLVVNDEPEKMAHNKYLLKPYEKGEIVKVAPFEEQISHPSVGMEPEKFRKRYVVIYRKDEQGKWTLKYTQGWESFDLLTTIKKEVV